MNYCQFLSANQLLIGTSNSATPTLIKAKDIIDTTVSIVPIVAKPATPSNPDAGANADKLASSDGLVNPDVSVFHEEPIIPFDGVANSPISSPRYKHVDMSFETVHLVAQSLGIALKGVDVSSYLDPQEPDSQNESTIIHGQVTQEPSIQSMDEDKDTTLPDSRTHPDNAQDGLSMTDRELGLTLTVYSAPSTLVGILSPAIGHDTQEPPVQSTEEVPYVQVLQEHSVQNPEARLRLDGTLVLVEPITARPMDTTNSCMSFDILSLNSTSMIINRPLHKESPIYLTTDNLSMPSLFSSKLSDLNFSCETERQYLVKKDFLERQSPVLAKGEVVMIKEILSLSKDTLVLESHEPVCASSDEITL